MSRLIAVFHEAYLERHGEKPLIQGGKHGRLLKGLLGELSENDLAELIRLGVASPEPFFAGGLDTILSAAGIEKLRALRRARNGNGSQFHRVEGPGVTALLNVEAELEALGLTVVRRDQGGQLRCACPFCPQDPPTERPRDPAFAISAHEGLWTCHRCGAKGNLFTLRRELRGASMVAHSARKARPRAKAATPVDEPLIQGMERVLWSDSGARALRYLRDERGFADETIRVFRLGYDRERNAIAIPYVLAGKPVGVKFRLLASNAPRKYERLAGHHHPPFNVDALDGEFRSVVVTEGELDAIAATQVDVGRPVVSAPNGAGQSVDEVAEALVAFDEVLIAFDADDAGEAGAVKLAQALGEFRCRRVRLPRKDLNACLVEGVGPDEIRAAIDAASPCGDTRVKHIGEWSQELLAEDSSTARGRSTGWTSLDQLLGGLRPGEVTLLTADTGQGKSSWVLDLARRQAERQNAVLIASLELPTKTVARKLLSAVAGQRWDKLEPDGRSYCVGRLAEAPIYLLDHYGPLPIDRVRLEVEYAVRRHGVSLFVLDHLHFALGVARRGEDERLQIDGAAQAVQAMALSLGIHVAMVMHPAKLKADREGRARPPEIGDLKGSSGPPQYADNVMRIARADGAEPRSVLKLLKVRSELARLGSVVYRFDPESLRFTDLQVRTADAGGSA